MDENGLFEVLKRYGQYHLIEHYRGLEEKKKEEFIKNIEKLDLELVFKLYNHFSTPESDKPRKYSNIKNSNIIGLHKTAEELRMKHLAKKRGEELIRQGKVAVLIVAGGQGSRLGFDYPKGMFPISPVKEKPLFQLFAEQIRAMEIKYQRRIPLLIMTSEENHKTTVEFFESVDFYNLDRENVFFFEQNMLPSITPKGRLIRSSDTSLYVNPDGHGGSLKALYGSGLLSRLLSLGYEELFYCQVDNPLVKIADPVFIGYHMMHNAEVSTKVVRKRSPEEKVGLYLNVDGKDRIIEYSDLEEEYNDARDEKGDILYWAGNTAIHIFSLEFIMDLNKNGFALPYHCARKKIEYPLRKNLIRTIDIWKFETFVFDAIPLAKRTCCMEVKREEEFSPVKNKEGLDSPITAKKDMINLYRSWFEKAGIFIPEHVPVEISPLFAFEEEDFMEKIMDFSKEEIEDMIGQGIIYLG
ncbi:MAG: UTP--glucose-1-phosphate uridylyltransferase [Syntrophorhabdaceae bacterium]|nr:UTP--glucose-1-phosphate uridylyltransferase [Syntrophorhabdaceae bacterium]